MSSPNSARMAAAYSARLRRWNVRRPGFGFAAAAPVERGFERIDQRLPRRGVGLLRRVLRRHHAGAQLADHLLGDIRLLGRVGDIEPFERQVAAKLLAVVTVDAEVFDERVARGDAVRNRDVSADRGDNRRRQRGVSRRQVGGRANAHSQPDGATSRHSAGYHFKRSRNRIEITTIFAPGRQGNKQKKPAGPTAKH